MESGRFLPPELGAEIKQKVELTPQEKEILKKVIYLSESGQARLETSRFKKGCVKCVLLYEPNTEFESIFNVF